MIANLLMRRLFGAILSALLVFPAGLVSASLETLDQYPPLLIGPGDLLLITVYNEPDLHPEYSVDGEGNIVFPLVGEVSLAGLTQAQASRALAKELSRFQKDPQITVMVKNTANYAISVLGHVVRPGKFQIRGKPTLLSALAEAGGPREEASLNSTILIRGNEKHRIYLERYLTDTNNEYKQPNLLPGDVLMIPKSSWPNLREWSIIVGILSSSVILSLAVAERTRR